MHGSKTRDFAKPERGPSPESAGNESFPPEVESSVEGPMLDSSQLFAGRKQVVIGHNGQRYVLKITRYGKLILNK